MRKIFVSLCAVLLVCGTAEAQNVLGRLGERAKQAVENNIGNKVEKGVNDILDGKKKDRDDSRAKARNQKDQVEQKAAAQPDGAWKCPECGATATGRFCPECGAKKPEAKPAQPDGAWTCPECGAKATGRFCPECGAKKPDGSAGASKAAAAPSRPTPGKAGNEAPLGDVPNPYTIFDTPENPFDVALGLPKNDDSEEPPLRKAHECVSYAAYTYPALGGRGKTFVNAERKRIYRISFQKWHDGTDLVTKFLAIVDSMAIYKIDDAKKTITKMPLDAIQDAAGMFTVKKEKVLDESEIASSQGRWCYAHSGATESTMEFAGHQSKEVNGETTYTDLETGITIETTHGFDHDYLRNIHLGVFYPEIYELPTGYKMVVMYLTKGMKQMEEMEQKWKSAEEQMKGLQGKSTEELLQMLKNK